MSHKALVTSTESRLTFDNRKLGPRNFFRETRSPPYPADDDAPRERAPQGTTLRHEKTDDPHSGDCGIFVSVSGKDSNAGTATAPLRTVEAAVALRRSTAANVRCTIHLASGKHFVRAPPLVLGSEDSNTTWLGDGESSVLSAGLPVEDKCWVASAKPGVFSCTMPEAAPFGQDVAKTPVKILSKRSSISVNSLYNLILTIDNPNASELV